MVLVADLIVKSLEEAGVAWAFGISGGPLAGIFRALSVSKKIRVIMTQHESAAGFLAVGNYLYSEKRSVPVVFGTSGPGSTNIITGVTAAFEEKVPLIVVTANIASKLKGKRATQDSFETGINTIKMLSPVTSSTLVLDSTDDLDKKIKLLYQTALMSSLPVHLNVPGDIAHMVVTQQKEVSHVSQPDHTVSP